MAEEESKSKRRVRDPETFRERAVKAAESDQQPAKRRRVSNFLARLLGFIFKPIGRALKFIFYRQPFLLLRRPFHLIGMILLPVYLRNSWRELKQVTWPSWQQSRQLTLAVIIFAAIFGAVIAGLDYGLDKFFKQLLLK